MDSNYNLDLDDELFIRNRPDVVTLPRLGNKTCRPTLQEGQFPAAIPPKTEFQRMSLNDSTDDGDDVLAAAKRTFQASLDYFKQTSIKSIANIKLPQLSKVHGAGGPHPALNPEAMPADEPTPNPEATPAAVSAMNPGATRSGGTRTESRSYDRSGVRTSKPGASPNTKPRKPTCCRLDHLIPDARGDIQPPSTANRTWCRLCGRPGHLSERGANLAAPEDIQQLLALQKR
ncbi:unnamed protein product, partial [Mesorhabditis spiculigera]